MRIISRTVITPHRKEEVIRILKNSCSRYYAAEFEDDHFRIMFPTRWHRNRGFVPIRGSIKEQGEHIKVVLNVHSGFVLYAVMSLFMICILLGLYNLIVNSFSFYMFLSYFGAALVINIVIYLISLFEGIMCLDGLEHRLTR